MFKPVSAFLLHPESGLPLGLEKIDTVSLQSGFVTPCPRSRSICGWNMLDALAHSALFALSLPTPTCEHCPSLPTLPSLGRFQCYFITLPWRSQQVISLSSVPLMVQKIFCLAPWLLEFLAYCSIPQKATDPLSKNFVFLTLHYICIVVFMLHFCVLGQQSLVAFKWFN